MAAGGEGDRIPVSPLVFRGERRRQCRPDALRGIHEQICHAIMKAALEKYLCGRLPTVSSKGFLFLSCANNSSAIMAAARIHGTI
jgi:hypothetical protein